jgi:hypothetical protein
MSGRKLETSRALWNRERFDPSSDEVLAQILDRGEVEAWRELYRMASHDAAIRRRIHRLVLTVPVALPHFWLAALQALDKSVDMAAPVPPYPLEAEL